MAGAALLVAVTGSPTRGPDGAHVMAHQAHLRELKRLECSALLALAGGELDERTGLGIGPPPGAGLREDAVLSGSPPLAGAPRNIRINDRVSDKVFEAVQSEVSLAACESLVVAAWNDGETEAAPGPVGFGYSRDGGATWVDGGVLPLGDEVAVYVSDPVVAVNEKTCEFYLAALAISTPPARNAVAVLKGGFTDAGFQWQSPVLARATRDSLPDKPWLAADSLSGNLYLSYTMFVRTLTLRTDWIDFQRSTDDNASWTAPLKVSSTRDEGLVQGSRPVVGPAGEVHLVWSAVDTSAASGGLDHFRARTSRDGGVRFGREADVAGVYSNFGSGAPGFNLGRGTAFPSVAVDRSRGVRRGRVYVCWQEALNVFDDVPDSTGSQEEREPNDQPMDASPLQVGSAIRGTITSSDLDFFVFSGLRGQTVELYLDSLATGLAPELRLFCTDGSTLLAFNRPLRDARPRFLFFTLPASGSYYAKVESSGPGSGGYRLRTGFVRQRGERGRDHRDLFVAHSDDGLLWSDPVRLNDDPGWFDDWLPEVAVSAEGRAYAAWYDWRDSPASSCGGWSSVYLARSDDGGDSWSSLGPVADRLTNWSEVGGLKVPNQRSEERRVGKECRSRWSPYH